MTYKLNKNDIHESDLEVIEKMGGDINNGCLRLKINLDISCAVYRIWFARLNKSK